MKLNKIAFLFVFLLNSSFAQLALQKPDSLIINRENYLFPIFPGRPNLLTGSMGELRSTHFHAGLDIRTSNMIGIAVRAAKNGYVSRIIVGSYGYGKAIILTHPDGNQTLYAHLDQFKGALANFVLQEHYSRKSFELDLFPQKDLLLVKQGDTIALSGNTGGSQGPHLHFEIRDSANHALNPLTFKFSEIIDTYPPSASKIALITLDSSSRINDKFGRFEFYLLKTPSGYIFSKPILAHGKIGVELLATDRMNNSAFRFGINYIEVYANESKVFTQAIDQIDFEETKGIQNIINYKILKQRGVYFNKLYVDDGNTFEYHKESIASGIISVSDKLVTVKIEMKDTYGNKSEARFSLQPNPPTMNVLLMDQLAKPIDFEITKNVLKVTSKACPQVKLKIISGKDVTYQTPSYGTSTQKVFLIDLKNILPDSLIACGNSIATNLKDRITSGIGYKYYSERAEVSFPSGALYDTLYFNESYRKNDNLEVFTLGSPLVPLYNPIDVILKPSKKYLEDKTTGVYNANGANLGGTWDGGNIRFSARELGSFTIQQDITPPSIARIFLTNRNARFRISDKHSGIASFEATINGEWLLMDYEYKTGVLLAERSDKTKLLKGDFQLRVIDNAGNQKIFNQKIY